MTFYRSYYYLKALFATLIISVAAGFFVAAPSMAWAEEVATLSDEERYQANLRRWQSMTEEERQAIRAKAANLTQEDHTVLKQRVREYRALPDQKKRALREGFRRFRELPSDQREGIERRWKQFRQLPPEKREEIHRHFQERHKAQGIEPGKGSPQRKEFEIPAERREQVQERRQQLQQYRENRQKPSLSGGDRSGRRSERKHSGKRRPHQR